jgi:hypothetical protein
LNDVCQNTVSGVLTGPSDGLFGTVEVNSDPFYYDVVRTVTSEATWLCPAGPAPAPTLTLEGTSLPTGTIQFDLSVPVDETTLGAIRAQGWDAVEASWQPGDYSYRPVGLVKLAPVSGRAFPFGTVTMDVSALRDVLGRPYQAQGSLSVSITQPEAIVDRTLTSVPSTAVVGTSPILANGTLSFPSSTLLQAVIGLGTAAGATRLRILHRAICGQSTRQMTTLVSSDGYAAPVTVACADAPQEIITTLVGQGPYYLVVGTPNAPTPCITPPPAVPGYEVDEYSFLP